MSKNSYSMGIPKLATNSSIITADFEYPELVELENHEAEMYCLLFPSETGAPVEVKEPLQECLRDFIDIGLLKKNYYKFVDLCHKSQKNQFDAVEKDGLHVINNQGDVSFICADKRGDWEVVCTMKKELIQKFFKNKNFDNNFYTSNNLSVNSSNSITYRTKNP